MCLLASQSHVCLFMLLAACVGDFWQGQLSPCCGGGQVASRGKPEARVTMLYLQSCWSCVMAVLCMWVFLGCAQCVGMIFFSLSSNALGGWEEARQDFWNCFAFRKNILISLLKQIGREKITRSRTWPLSAAANLFCSECFPTMRGACPTQGRLRSASTAVHTVPLACRWQGGAAGRGHLRFLTYF